MFLMGRKGNFIIHNKSFYGKYLRGEPEDRIHLQRNHTNYE